MLFGLKLFQRPTSNDELADKIDRVERQVKMLELEWESTYNKLRALLARMNKREERATEVTPGRMRGPDTDGEPGDDIDRLIALRRGRR